jgi:hypothetical protein
MGLQVRVIDPQTASNTLEGLHLRRPSCGELVSTAKTTMLPAHDHHWRQEEQAARSQYLLFVIRRTIGNGIVEQFR